MCIGLTKWMGVRGVSTALISIIQPFPTEFTSSRRPAAPKVRTWVVPAMPLKTTTIAPLLSLVAPRGNRRGSLWRSWQLGLFEPIFLRNAWWNEKNGEQFRIKPGEMKWTEWIWQSWIIRDLINYQQWPQVDNGWLLILKMLANHGQPVLGWKRPEEADWTGLWWKKCSVFVLVLDFIGFGHIMMRHTLMDPQRPIYDAVWKCLKPPASWQTFQLEKQFRHNTKWFLTSNISNPILQWDAS